MADENTIKCYCRECKRETNHKVLFSERVSSDPESDYWWSQDYMIVECCGCNCIAHCDGIWEECNTIYDEKFGGEWTPTVYRVVPNPISVIDPISVVSLPLEIRPIYKETIDCINRGNHILAGVGCRATIEAICLAEEISGKDLADKINNMEKAHLITKKDRDHLHAIRFIGNYSIHDIEPVDIDELKIVGNILNTTLTNQYIIHEEYQKLKKKPVSSYEDFLKLLNKRLRDIPVATCGTLEELLKGAREIISADRDEFESRLIADILNGRYKRLSLLSPEPNTARRYKVNPL